MGRAVRGAHGDEGAAHGDREGARDAGVLEAAPRGALGGCGARAVRRPGGGSLALRKFSWKVERMNIRLSVYQQLPLEYHRRATVTIDVRVTTRPAPILPTCRRPT